MICTFYCISVSSNPVRTLFSYVRLGLVGYPAVPAFLPNSSYNSMSRRSSMSESKRETKKAQWVDRNRYWNWFSPWQFKTQPDSDQIRFGPLLTAHVVGRCYNIGGCGLHVAGRKHGDGIRSCVVVFGAKLRHGIGLFSPDVFTHPIRSNSITWR